MSRERPCVKGRKRHRFGHDGYCVYCNEPRTDQKIADELEGAFMSDMNNTGDDY